jgi:hypothetical protein
MMFKDVKLIKPRWKCKIGFHVFENCMIQESGEFFKYCFHCGKRTV